MSAPATQLGTAIATNIEEDLVSTVRSSTEQLLQGTQPSLIVSAKDLYDLLDLLALRTATTPTGLELQKAIARLFVCLAAAHAGVFAGLSEHFAALSTALLSAHARDELCVCCGDTFRSLLLHAPFAECVWECRGEAHDDADFFATTPLGLLSSSLVSAHCCVCSEAWSSLHALLFGATKKASSFILNHFVLSVGLFISCIRSPNYVTRRQMLKLLVALVTDKRFSRARQRLLASPALLCSLLDALNDPSHHIRYEAHHCVKVFIANPAPCLPIRYLLLINRDALAMHVSRYTSGDPDADKQLALERDVLLTQLCSLPPLSREDELSLGYSVP